MKRLLVANRGEIARRIFRTAREMGIGTVAVFSDADERAPHVGDADLAVRLPGDSPAETYLRADLIIAAAKSAGADAVHPGYGFLAENAEFAAAVAGAGLTWVGPPASAIEAMGSKLAAKEAMRAAGVPTLPWATDPEQAADVGFPLLVKASAGGGGRGMRIVRDASGLAEAVASARREARAAFGDETVFLERYVDDPRHVEIQVFADQHGNVVSLFERECSIQRRHQKLVEECPSPAVDDDLRARMGEAAVSAAKAVGYLGAGTVEFVLDPDGEFAFLEMNTRLQVEHPVTEAVTGLDLVRLQLLVVDGQPLPAEALAPRITGHAIEVRLVAEDPEQDFLPQSGRLRDWRVPAAVAVGSGRRERVTVDAGFEAGTTVSPHYDSLLAKLIAHARTRAEAAAALARVLDDSRIFGVATNRELLAAILREPEFLAGGTDTGYLTRHPPTDLLTADPSASRARRRLSAAAAVLAWQARNRAAAPVWGRLPSGWRNNPSQPQRVVLSDERGRPATVTYQATRSGWEFTVDDEPVDLTVQGTAAEGLQGVDEGASQAVDLTVDGLRQTCHVTLTTPPGAPGGVSTGGELLDVHTPLGATTWTVQPRFTDPGAALGKGSLTAPMPGSVLRVLAEPGTAVQAGTPLVVLEAMKMEHTVAAPAAGIVEQVTVAPGQQVEAGALLAVVAADAEAAASDPH